MFMPAILCIREPESKMVHNGTVEEITHYRNHCINSIQSDAYQIVNVLIEGGSGKIFEQYGA